MKSETPFDKKDNEAQIHESLAESEFSIIYPDGEPREPVGGADLYDRPVGAIQKNARKIN